VKKDLKRKKPNLLGKETFRTNGKEKSARRICVNGRRGVTKKQGEAKNIRENDRRNHSAGVREGKKKKKEKNLSIRQLEHVLC